MSTTDTTFDWSRVATSWDARRAHVESTKAALTERLLAGLRLRAGARVLELGAGTGELSVRIADSVGQTGSVLATDVAAGMVELIRATVEDRPQVTVDRVDAADTGLERASFDAVAFRMGLMLVPDPAAALAEFRHLLRDGGRLGVAVWSGPEHNPWLTAAGMALMVHGLVQGGPPTGPGGLFSLSSAQTLTDLAEGAGFTEVSVQPVDTTFRFATADDHFDTVTSLAPPFAAALATAPPEIAAAARRTAADLLAPHRTDDGYAVPGQALLLLATA
jgi:SAM-dependent methyltransferase